MDTPLILIACSQRKLSIPAPAREMYTGALFKRAVAYCDALQLPFLILSAKYGFIGPYDLIEPYDQRMKRYRGAFPEQSGYYIGGKDYFQHAPERFQPLVPHFKGTPRYNRGLLVWIAQVKKHTELRTYPPLPSPLL